ncbi:MAG: hypothetical protein R2736_08640, partial [Solirubrobacterales bacterium]
QGRPLSDDSWLMLFNAHHEDVAFTLPNQRFGSAWCSEIDTSAPDEEQGARRFEARDAVTVPARSVLVLRRAG